MNEHEINILHHFLGGTKKEVKIYRTQLLFCENFIYQYKQENFWETTFLRIRKIEKNNSGNRITQRQRISSEKIL